MIFFFKQKTAYEMRISDWSSDVCSSDLGCPRSSNLLREASARSSTFAPAGSRWPTPPSTSAIYVIRCDGVEIHRSARRHGVSDADILHAVDHSLVVVDVDRDADPPKVLVIGARKSVV